MLGLRRYRCQGAVIRMLRAFRVLIARQRCCEKMSNGKAQTSSAQVAWNRPGCRNLHYLSNREFKVPMTAMKRVADAQESLRVQFAEHACKEEG
jgi:hypothetical protein